MRSRDVYRALLLCYPASFRHEYGGEMVGAFTAQLRDARHSRGHLAAGRVWIATLLDLVPTAFREHRHVIHQDLRHALRVFAASPGFTAAAVLSLALGIGANAAIFSLLNSVLMSTLPVRAATYSNNGLFSGADNADEIVVEGYTRTGQGDRGSRYDAVAPRYFATLGIPVLLGREISDADHAGARSAIVINETFARRFFTDRTPIGMHVTQQYADERRTYEVVGVVRDSRQGGRLRGEVEHRFYTPITDPAASISTVTFIVRSAADRPGLLDTIRRTLRDGEPNMCVVRATTVAEAIDSRIVQDRLLAQLSIVFGVVALLLAAIGLYGVLSHGVTRRTNEIGIRKALGAQQGTLIAMVLRETGGLLLVGMIAGAGGSIAAVRLITSRLYGLSPGDPATMTSAVAALVVAALATWLPAYRASRVDPLVALRQE